MISSFFVFFKYIFVTVALNEEDFILTEGKIKSNGLEGMRNLILFSSVDSWLGI